MTLLIVDDQRSVYLYIIKAIDLAAIGFDTVLYASNGREALELIAAKRPSAMILDIQMPEMDGLALLAALREQKHKQPRTIILSAYDEFAYAQKCISYGVQYYSLKPIDQNEIRKQLIAIADAEADTDEGTGEPPPATDPSEMETIIRIREYMNDHYQENLTLAEMATRFYMNRYQICRLFKKQYGVHYQDCLCDVRMAAARALLGDPRYKLYEISTLVGFRDASYFGRVFKAKYGVSPRAYRAERYGDDDDA